MDNEYLDYLNKTTSEYENRYATMIVRQHNLRNYAYAHLLRPGGIPPELGIILNYLYDSEIKSTKLNNIELESSIFNSIILNNL